MTSNRLAKRLRSARRRRDSASLLEDLDAVIGAIADIDKVVIAEDDAMRMTAASSSERALGAALAGGRASRAPLADILPGGVEDDDAVVAIAVGDIDVAACSADRADAGIDRDVRGFVQQRMAGVGVVGVVARGKGVCPRRRRGGCIADTLCADLHHKGCSGALRIGGLRVVFLDDPVAIAANPDVTLVIDKATMGALRQISRVSVIGPGLSKARITPTGHGVALAVVRDNRRRRDRRGGRVLPNDGARFIALEDPAYADADLPAAVEGVDVVILVHAASGDLAGYPGVGDAVAADRCR